MTKENQTHIAQPAMPPSQTMTAPHHTPKEFLTQAIAKELDKSMETLMETETDDRRCEAETNTVNGPTHQPSHLPASAPAAPTTRPLIESSAEATGYAANPQTTTTQIISNPNPSNMERRAHGTTK
jgi:hypothetical protein